MPEVAASSFTGLTQEEALLRLAAEGANEFPDSRHHSVFGIALSVLREPMLLLLLAAGAIYMLLGDIDDALILLGLVCLTITITIVQEVRSDRAIEALRSLSLPIAIVIRDGHRRSIPSREVVRGDLLVINEGSRIAADGWVLQANDLRIDEALLTGESVAVKKEVLSGPRPDEPPRPGGDCLPYAFSGTLTVSGTGLLLVNATGSSSQIGRIGESLASLETEAPGLVKQTRGLVRGIALAALAVSALAVLLYGSLRGDWLAALLSGIALTMSLLPEELPIVLALFMTIGALRMSRSRVLARRGAAIETLGSATVLCTDKTGTLTMNRMTVVELRLPDGAIFQTETDEGLPSAEFVELARLGKLASEEQPFDPMEQAFHELADNHTVSPAESEPGGGLSMQQKYALAPELLAMSQVWSAAEFPAKLVAAKGAPEAISELCGLDPDQKARLDAAAEDMARRGLRVLALAEARWLDEKLPETQRSFDFAYRGVVGLADPIRQNVPEAVSELREAGIRVVMITGDYPATAHAIAEQAGIDGGGLMTGEEVERLNDEDLVRQVGDIAVFARVMPEQKLRIVRALKAAGEVVAMTGDGVNDAPSLKAANIGIAMGQRGTDVARAASMIVLLDDDFASIVAAVRLGRRIYDNIRKATGFIFAVHLPIGGLALAPLLFGWPLILGPVHIALLEIVIDPVCSLAFEAEPEEPDVMRRKPRKPESPLISRDLLAWSVLQGTIALTLLIVLAGWTYGSGVDEQHVRATSFAGLIVSVFILVLANRSFQTGRPGRRSGARNWVMWGVLGATLGLNAMVLLLPEAAALFHFMALGPRDILTVAFFSLLLAALLALVKRYFRRGFAR